MRQLVFSGRVRPDSIDKSGTRTIYLWAWVYSDASVEVASEPYHERITANFHERLEALKAAVRTMAPVRDE